MFGSFLPPPLPPTPRAIRVFKKKKIKPKNFCFEIISNLKVSRSQSWW
jgi:hypothetical protein